MLETIRRFHAIKRYKLNIDTMSNNMNVSVIIPTMNRPESLSRTLKYIANGIVIPDQVIIIDQSDDNDKRHSNEVIIKETKSQIPGIEYHFQLVTSLTKARNTGVSFARNEIIVFSDDDVDVQEETFANIESMMSNTNIAMIGGVQIETAGRASLASMILGMASFRKRRKGHMARACYGRFPDYCGNETPTEWAMGFFFVVRKSLMDKWHIRFDENLKSYAYAEDLDFTYGYYLNAKEEHLKCIMSKKIKVRHNASMEYRIPKRKHTFMTVLHRYYIGNKHNLPMFEACILWCNLGILFQKVFRKEAPKDFLDAQFFYFLYRKDVLKGLFHDELWIKKS